MSFFQTSDQESQKILQALNDNPDLKACILEMIDITEDSANQLNRGDDAEDAVIQAIRKTGSVLLKEWAQSKADKAAKETEEQPGVRMHEKKDVVAHISSKNRGYRNMFFEEEKI